MRALYWLCLFGVLILTLGSGCQPVGRPPMTEPPRQEVIASSEAENQAGQPPVTKWAVPAGSAVRRFLGDSLLITTSDKKNVYAVDASGASRWTVDLSDMVVDFVVKADLSEGLALTAAGSVWLDLRSGEVLGPGPVKGPITGQFLWHGDWLLIGQTRFQSPVNPQAPGKSSEYTVWTLYRSKRTDKMWEDTGELTDKGRGLATMSSEGNVVVTGPKDSSDIHFYENGSLVRSIPMRRPESVAMVTAGGKHVVERYTDGFTIYGANGTVVVRKSYPGNDVSVWGDRIVVSDGHAFSVYDTSGDEVFSHSGSVPRNQTNDTYLLVGDGNASHLLDETGKVRFTWSGNIVNTLMTADGRWLYRNTQDTVEVHQIPK